MENPLFLINHSCVFKIFAKGKGKKAVTLALLIVCLLPERMALVMGVQLQATNVHAAFPLIYL